MLVRKGSLGMLLLAANCFIGTMAQASIVQYNIILTVQDIAQRQPCIPEYHPRELFGCGITVGSVFKGQFGVDESILSTDGINTSAAIYDFRLPFGDAVYSTGITNLTLLGFRNPSMPASAPGFVIENGDVVDFYGGVYGFADVPFIDMYPSPLSPRNRFLAYDAVIDARGSITIERIPEPATLFLVGVSLATAAFIGRLRKVADST